MRLQFLTMALAAALSLQAVNVSTTAGRLRADLDGTTVATLTDLAVVGTLDARDFLFIADSMPALTSLNLGGVDIVPYKNAGTPTIAMQHDFEANALPTVSLMAKPLTSLVLPQSLRVIGEAALGGCTSLKTITLPETLDSIGPYAFAGCTALEKIELPAAVSVIGDGAFAYCSSLKSVTVKSGSRLHSVGRHAMADCQALATVNLGNRLTRLGEGALAGTAITALDMSKLTGLTTIDGWTAVGAPIKAAVLPPAVVNVGDGTLFNAREITTLEIPATVEYIGNYAMANNRGLQTIVTRAKTVPALGEDVWWIVDQEHVTLRVPAGTLDDYSNAAQWRFFTIVEDAVKGDVNQDGNVDVGDVNAVLSIILAGGTADADLHDRADVNNDGTIDVGDVNAILTIILRG